MRRAEGGAEIYDNRIEELFLEYFEDRGIDPQRGNIKQTKFNAAWRYIYNILFRPDKNTVRYNNKNSKINYDDIEQLNNICDIYIDLCFEYNIIPCQYGFYRLTGIARDTLNRWEKGASRAGEIEGATSPHSDIVKKISDAYKEFYRDNLSDGPVGQMAVANNDEELGLMYGKNQGINIQNNYMLPTQGAAEIAARHSIGQAKRPELPDIFSDNSD